MIVVSACLLGENCKYDGGNNFNTAVVKSVENKEVLAICPEMAGGLDCPRTPVEIKGGRAVSKEGKDLTKEFMLGAEKCFAQIHETGGIVEKAILKAKSPSCGSGEIYDGTFSGKLVPGYGYFAKMLKEAGIPVFSEKDFNLGEEYNDKYKR